MNVTPKCSDKDERLRRKQAVAGLLNGCPHGPKNPAMCPLNSVRKRRPSTRMKWLASLNDEEIEFIVSYHGVCLKWQNAGCP